MRHAGHRPGRRFTVRQARRAARAEGAGESGLSRLIELHAFNAAGDAAVAISLAGTLFFQVPTGEARGQVALFLGLTMLPVRDRRAADRPVPGPLQPRPPLGDRLDDGDPGVPLLGARHRRRHRLALAVPRRARRASSRPRRTASPGPPPYPGCSPERLTLVKANARVSLAGVVGATVSAPIAGLASTAGPEWSLRYAFVVFVIATDRGDPAAHAGRLQPRRGHAGADAGGAGPPAGDPASGRGRGSRRRSRSRCAPTAGRAGCPAS